MLELRSLSTLNLFEYAKSKCEFVHLHFVQIDECCTMLCLLSFALSGRLCLWLSLCVHTHTTYIYQNDALPEMAMFQCYHSKYARNLFVLPE